MEIEAEIDMIEHVLFTMDECFINFTEIEIALMEVTLNNRIQMLRAEEYEPLDNQFLCIPIHEDEKEEDIIMKIV